jgi:hypothetical protein
MTLPANQPWTVAPVVRALVASPTNGALFTNPNNQRAAWIQLVIRQMISQGYFEPGNSATALGAIAALSQAYGYFMAVAINDPTLQLGAIPLSQTTYGQVMSMYLTDAYNAVTFWQSTPSYQAALATTKNWIRPGGINAQDIARAAGVATPAAPAAASSSNTMLLVGLVGAAGVAAYLAFA